MFEYLLCDLDYLQLILIENRINSRTWKNNSKNFMEM